MSTNFPGSLDDNIVLPNPTAGSNTNSPSLSSGQTNQNDAIKALEAKVGTGASTPTNNNLLVGTGTGTSAWSKASPTGAVVGTTDTQTLTNKTLTSPTINTPTITNATLTADTVSGFTTSNSGTIYGISVAGGVITSAGSIGSGTLATNAVTAANLATSAITLGYAQITSNFTTTNTSATYITGLGVNVTIPAGGRRVRITVFLSAIGNSTSSNGCVVTIYSGASAGTLTTQIAQANKVPATNETLICSAVQTPSAGSIAYSAAVVSVTSGTTTVTAGNTNPCYILVEAI